MIAEFYEQVGNISAEDLDKVKSNIDDSIITEALDVYAKTYKK
jgi:hypothetical protein